MAFVGTFAQIKLLFGLLVIQLCGIILKQLFTSVSVKVVDINLATIHLHLGVLLITMTQKNRTNNTMTNTTDTLTTDNTT